MNEPIPLNQDGRDLLVEVEHIAERIKRGEVVGIISVCVLASSECETQIAGLFHDGYTMAGHLLSLQLKMIDMEEPTEYEVLLDD